MAIQSYQKAEIELLKPKAEKTRKSKTKTKQKKKKGKGPETQNFNISSERAKRVTQWISIFLIVVGVSVIGYSAYPYLLYYAKRLIPFESEEAVVSSGSDPSVLSLQSRQSPQYFENVDKNIALVSQELEGADADYTDVDGEFLLSVPKIDLEKVPVKLNVDSFDESEYDRVLESKLAHFKGSSVPDKVGTTFVYGHSTAEWFAQANPNFFGSVFTYLPKVNIGDEIFVDYEGRRLRYVVTRVHEIEPDDLSPVFENNGRKLLKLMTCTPVGVGTDRLIVVAEQI